MCAYNLDVFIFLLVAYLHWFAPLFRWPSILLASEVIKWMTLSSIRPPPTDSQPLKDVPTACLMQWIPWYSCDTHDRSLSCHTHEYQGNDWGFSKKTTLDVVIRMIGFH